MIIGTCYKYTSSTTDYSPCFNFANYLNSDSILNSIFLYFNYTKLENQLLNLKEINKLDYYLINHQLIKQIKLNSNYEEIIKILKKNNEINIFEDENNYKKKLLSVIKSLSLDLLQNNTIEIETINDDDYEQLLTLDILPITYYDNNNLETVIIYNNFELLSKKTIDSIIKKELRTNLESYKCNFIDGKIVINYPNKNENNQYISLIGKLSEENVFLTEYILIYESNKDREIHLYNILPRLNTFLNNCHFINNTEIITFDGVNKNGRIIKYENNNLNTSYVQRNNINTNNLNLSKIDFNNKKTEFILEQMLDIKNEEDKNIIDDKIKKDEKKINKEISKQNIRNFFTISPLIGLVNIGATCYMNATLQCFCHIEKFVNYFKYSPQIISIFNNDKNTLTYSFKLLIENLWPDKYDSNTSKKYFSPDEFKEKISSLNPLFKGIAANDAKDLVNFIIMKLHNELNKVENPNIIINNILDQSNQSLVFNNFLQNFISNNKSIISDLFYSTNCNLTECGNCHVKTYNYQIYFFIVFPLEEVRKFRYNEMINNNFNFFNNKMNFNEVDLFDCFNYDCKINYMSGDNSMYCNYCKNYCSSMMKTYLVTGPEILILLLNRGKGIEFNVKINFWEELNLQNYIEHNETGYYYKLIGVITHLGESSMSGHFIAYCRDPISNNKWHKYNDAIVNEVNDFENEVINFAMPYLLFYQKIK